MYVKTLKGVVWGVITMSQQGEKERLRQLIEKKCLITDMDVTLSTGSESSFYFDCKRAALNGECLSLIVDQFINEIDRLPTKPEAIGGLTMGADFIVSGVIAKANSIGHSIKDGSIVRKEIKKHGTRNKIENELPADTKIVVVDDVITSGSSIQQACEEFSKNRYEIVGIIALVDRQTGGKERLEDEFVLVRAIFKKDDFPVLTNKTASNDVKTRAFG